MELGLNLSKDALMGNKRDEIMTALKNTFDKQEQLIEEKQVATEKINEAKILTQRIIEKDLKESHNPRRLTELLNQFTLDSSPLKYSTHPLETSSQFNNFDSFVSAFQEDQMIELKQLKSDLWNYLIYPFLYQKDDEVWLDKDNKLIDTYCWGEEKFKLGWKYKNLLKEMFEKQQNLGYIKFPLSTKIDKQFVPEYRVSGKYLTTWNDFVEVFKNEIEFRYNKLEELIFDITNPLRTNFNDNIEIVGLSGLNFYTYTSNIKKALKLLISPYNSYANAISPKLIIRGEYNQKGKVITIKIINEGSFWDAILDESIDKVQLSSGKGQLKSVKDLLYGLCDWSLESRFRVEDKYKYCRFNYLGKKYKILPREIDIEPIIGHTHILTFLRMKKILLLEDRKTRQELFLRDNNLSLTDLPTSLHNTLGDDCKEFLEKIKTKNDLIDEMLEGYDVIVAHRSGLSAYGVYNVFINYFKRTGKKFVVFSGGINGVIYISEEFLLLINSKQLYSRKLLDFIKSEELDVNYLSYGNKWKLNYLIRLSNLYSLENYAEMQVDKNEIRTLENLLSCDKGNINQLINKYL
ncbi:MAG: hypothetical protein IPH20_13615 [Bacteroidales bacterium]|nr:hypothetical protein [Bacteroidales bacterium]